MLKIFIGLIIGIAGTTAFFWQIYEDVEARLIERTNAATLENDSEPIITPPIKRDFLADVFYDPEVGYALDFEIPYLFKGIPEDATYSSTGSFYMTRTDKLISFAPSDIEHVCFHSDNNSNGAFAKLDLYIFLKLETRKKLYGVLENNIKKNLTFNYQDHEISPAVTTKPLLENNKQYLFSDEEITPANTEDLGTEFVFSSRQANNAAIMSLAKYLSYEAVPKGCSPAFDPKIYPWWDTALMRFWSIRN